MTTVRDYWDELVTSALLGTDRRDPPDPPAGPLADVVADTAAVAASDRMLTAVSACTVVRRTGLVPLAPAATLAPPPSDARPMLPVAAAARWRPLVGSWPVLEDEWLLAVAAGGWRLSPDVLVGLLRRHRGDAARRALVGRLGGPLVPWLVDHQPDLAAAPGQRPVDPLSDLPGLPVPPALVDLLDAGGGAAAQALGAGLDAGSFGLPHRAVLINFVARMRRDQLDGLATVLGSFDGSSPGSGLAHLLADLAATRNMMLEEIS